MPDVSQMPKIIVRCNAADLSNGAEAVPFDVRYNRQTCSAFAIGYEDLVGAVRWHTSHNLKSVES
jgi:hypothetical protein